MRRLLSMVLAKHAGQTITLELATSIAKELLGVAENLIDVDQFEPLEFRGFVLACERLELIVDEIHPLHVAQYDETETYRAGIALNMDYERLVDLERAGRLMQFTARTKETGELVGSMRIFLGTDIHTQTLYAHVPDLEKLVPGDTFATDDVFYIKPAHRGGFLAIKLWKYAEQCGLKVGARALFFDSKLVNKADKLAEYLGYTPYAKKHAKVI